MIRVSVLYPNSEGATFDHTYYAEKHMTMVLDKLRSFGCERTEIDRGLASGTPGAPVPYMAIGYLIFDSIEGFQQGMATHGQGIMADIPNYTNVAPIIQISQIVG